MNGYDVAQVCTSGHLVNDSHRRFPDKNQAFCSTCGQRTIVACEKCQTPIRGDYHAAGVIGFVSSYKRPSFCGGCGASFPWTESALESGRELADELDGLSPEERDRLKKSFEEIARETPQAEVAATRIKRIMTKVGGEGASPSGESSRPLQRKRRKTSSSAPAHEHQRPIRRRRRAPRRSRRTGAAALDFLPWTG